MAWPTNQPLGELGMPVGAHDNHVGVEIVGTFGKALAHWFAETVLITHRDAQSVTGKMRRNIKARCFAMFLPPDLSIDRGDTDLGGRRQ